MNYMAIPGVERRKSGSETVGITTEYQIPSPHENLIINIVSGVTQVPVGDIKGKARPRTVTIARQLCYLFLRKYTMKSLNEIGAIFNKDHATILYGVNTIQDQIDVYPELKRLNDDIHNRILKAVEFPRGESE